MVKPRTYARSKQDSRNPELQDRREDRPKLFTWPSLIYAVKRGPPLSPSLPILPSVSMTSHVHLLLSVPGASASPIRTQMEVQFVPFHFEELMPGLPPLSFRASYSQTNRLQFVIWNS